MAFQVLRADIIGDVNVDEPLLPDPAIPSEVLLTPTKVVPSSTPAKAVIAPDYSLSQVAASTELATASEGSTVASVNVAQETSDLLQNTPPTQEISGQHAASCAELLKEKDPTSQKRLSESSDGASATKRKLF